jgi:beta-galactosidase
VDATGQVFATTRPGLLDDVFGLRLGSYHETEFLNELTSGRTAGQALNICFGELRIPTEAPRFDEIHLRGAKVVASIVGLDRDYPVATVNEFGKGRAIYVGIPARRAVFDVILDTELDRQSIRPALDVPPGVLARVIDETHLLYLNLDGENKAITVPGPARSILHNCEYSSDFTLSPFDADFIELVQRPAEP